MGYLRRENVTREIVAEIFRKNSDEDLTNFVDMEDMKIMFDVVMDKDARRYPADNHDMVLQLRHALNSFEAITKNANSLQQYGGRLGAAMCSTTAFGVLLHVYESRQSPDKLILTASKDGRGTIIGEVNKYQGCTKYEIDCMDGGNSNDGSVGISALLTARVGEGGGIKPSIIYSVKALPDGTSKALHISGWSTNENTSQHVWDKKKKDLSWKSFGGMV